MIALVRLVTGGMIVGVNVDHVIKITPSGATDSVLDLVVGSSLTVHGRPEALARDFNLNLVPTGAPSSQGSAPPVD